jgi:histidine ammonia-lyase
LWNDPGTGVMRHADAGYDRRQTGLRARAGPQPADAGDATDMLIEPGHLTLDQLQRIHQPAGHCSVALTRPRRHPRQRRVVQAAADGDAPVYGVNTGFGKLANQRISVEDLATLQLNLIRSHSVGVGEPLSPPMVRLMLALKAASLARGYSGVREEVVDTLLARHNAGVVPWVPCQGSVGASGDLAPLAHMSLALLGEGEVSTAASACRRARRWRSPAQALTLGPRRAWR